MGFQCYGSHCATRSPGMLMNNRKQPPEPPRRQCSVVDQATSHLENLTLNHSAYLSPHHHLQLHQKNQQHHFINTNNIHHSVQPQPLYANYAGQTLQTTVEIHAEKSQDFKVSQSNHFRCRFTFTSSNFPPFHSPIQVLIQSTQFHLPTTMPAR